MQEKRDRFVFIVVVPERKMRKERKGKRKKGGVRKEPWQKSF